MAHYKCIILLFFIFYLFLFFNDIYIFIREIQGYQRGISYICIFLRKTMNSPFSCYNTSKLASMQHVEYVVCTFRTPCPFSMISKHWFLFSWPISRRVGWCISCEHTPTNPHLNGLDEIKEVYFEIQSPFLNKMKVNLFSSLNHCESLLISGQIHLFFKTGVQLLWQSAWIHE